MEIEEITGTRHLTLDSPLDTLLGGKNIHVITMGCAHNQADSDTIASIFLNHGATVGTYEEADIIYINSCTVKTPSQDKAIRQACVAAEAGKVAILGGCVPQSMSADHRIEELVAEGKLILVGVLDDEQMEKLVQNIAAHKSDTLVTKRPVHNPVALPYYHSTQQADIIPICQGCLGTCTYCKTMHSRGRLLSYSIDTILKRVDAAIASPQISEIWLTGEDTLAWGLDANSGFYALLQPMLERVSKTQKMIRIGMTDPESVLHQQDDLITVLRHPNVYKFLHLPVQSASDNVLTRMKRRYTYQRYEDMIRNLQRAIPQLVIATDIIVGFPEETEEDHARTIHCLRSLQFQIVNVTQYYPRPNTLAAKMAQVPSHIKKQRSTEAAAVAVQNFNREQYIGLEEEVIVSEILPSFRNNRVVGAKTHNYLSVLIEMDGAEAMERDAVLELLKARGIRIGARVRVRITAATRVALAGILIQ